MATPENPFATSNGEMIQHQIGSNSFLTSVIQRKKRELPPHPAFRTPEPSLQDKHPIPSMAMPKDIKGRVFMREMEREARVATLPTVNEDDQEPSPVLNTSTSSAPLFRTTPKLLNGSSLQDRDSIPSLAITEDIQRCADVLEMERKARAFQSAKKLLNRGSLRDTNPIPSRVMPEATRVRAAIRKIERGTRVTTPASFSRAVLDQSPTVDFGPSPDLQLTPPPFGPSRALNLCTTPETSPRPTQRVTIEEKRERRHFNVAAVSAEQIPVFQPSPSHSAGEFENARPAPPVPTKKKKEVAFTNLRMSYEEAPQKQSFLDRVLGGFRHAPATSETAETDQTPAKMDTVLGAKLPSKLLGRSSSKRRIFGRRASDAAATVLTTAAEDSEASMRIAPPEELPPRAQTSLGHHYDAPILPLRRGSIFSKRASSEATTDAHKPAARKMTPGMITPLRGLGRSASLRYADAGIPPTPPSKDTPPDIKAIKESEQHGEPIVPFANETPTKTRGFLSTDSRVSPTKSGGYGSRGGARLVTAPSKHSLHASIVPEFMDPGDFQDVKSRVGGLGLEGFDMPNETHRKHSFVYSPSIYSERSPHPRRLSLGPFTPAPIKEQSEEDSPKLPKMPEMTEKVREPPRTGETGRTPSPIVYPELVNDPSIVEFMTCDIDLFSIPRAAGSSRDKRRASVVSALDQQTDSPSLLSPMSRHPSAQVSPLHLFTNNLEKLPSTVYTPPPQRARHPATDRKKTQAVLGSVDEHDDSPSLNVPSLPFTSPPSHQDLEPKKKIPVSTKRRDRTRKPTVKMSSSGHSIGSESEKVMPSPDQNTRDRAFRAQRALSQSLNRDADKADEDPTGQNARIRAFLGQRPLPFNPEKVAMHSPEDAISAENNTVAMTEKQSVVDSKAAASEHDADAGELAEHRRSQAKRISTANAKDYYRASEDEGMPAQQTGKNDVFANSGIMGSNSENVADPTTVGAPRTSVEVPRKMLDKPFAVPLTPRKRNQGALPTRASSRTSPRSDMTAYAQSQGTSASISSRDHFMIDLMQQQVQRQSEYQAEQSQQTKLLNAMIERMERLEYDLEEERRMRRGTEGRPAPRDNKGDESPSTLLFKNMSFDA